MERLKFTVIRSKWLNGSTLRPTEKGVLLRCADGLMCCLGFYCEQLVGSSPTELVGVLLPSIDVIDCVTASDAQKEALERLLFGEVPDHDMDTHEVDMVDLLANVNDNRRLEESTREVWLKKYFDEINVDVEFVD